MPAETSPEEFAGAVRHSGTLPWPGAKYLNLLWTLELARRLAGSGIVANALHPGTAWTGLTKGSEKRTLPTNLRQLWPVLRLIQRIGSPEKAARTSIYLASAPEAGTISGHYFESSTRPKNPGPAVLDRIAQEKAWDLAASLFRKAPTAITAEMAGAAVQPTPQ